jgi:hypothetical protein
VGYVGVYDLPTMHTEGDIQQRGSGETYIREWIGDRESLGATSPNRMADRRFRSFSPRAAQTHARRSSTAK